MEGYLRSTHPGDAAKLSKAVLDALEGNIDSVLELLQQVLEMLAEMDLKSLLADGFLCHVLLVFVDYRLYALVASSARVSLAAGRLLWHMQYQCYAKKRTSSPLEDLGKDKEVFLSVTTLLLTVMTCSVRQLDPVRRDSDWVVGHLDVVMSFLAVEE
jgi:hypothetical protein